MTDRFEAEIAFWATLGEVVTLADLREALERVRDAGDRGLCVRYERAPVCSSLQRLGLAEAEQGRLYVIEGV